MTVENSDVSHTGHKPPGFKFKSVIGKKYNRQWQRDYCAANTPKFVLIFQQFYPDRTSVCEYFGKFGIFRESPAGFTSHILRSNMGLITHWLSLLLLNPEYIAVVSSILLEIFGAIITFTKHNNDTMGNILRKWAKHQWEKWQCRCSKSPEFLQIFLYTP